MTSHNTAIAGGKIHAYKYKDKTKTTMYCIITGLATYHDVVTMNFRFLISSFFQFSLDTVCACVRVCKHMYHGINL